MNRTALFVYSRDGQRISARGKFVGLAQFSGRKERRPPDLVGKEGPCLVYRSQALSNSGEDRVVGKLGH